MGQGVLLPVNMSKRYYWYITLSIVLLRWVANLLDSILLVVLFVIIIGVDTALQSGDHIAISFIVWGVMAVGYYVYFEGIRGQTVGKLALKLSLVD
jgi:uncharacterized RDD family membrane protein YckC